ncbi:hypothetical protein GC176_11335 [bacterium]|nr:hypothetical protein [bacterium]
MTIYEPGQKKPLLRVQPVEGTLTERRFELSGRAGRGRIVANRNQLLGPLTRIYFTLNGSQLLTVELQEPEREPAGCLSVLAALTMAPVIKIILVILLFPLVALAIFIEGNAPLAAMVRVIAAVIGIAVAAACVILPVLNAIGVFKFTWLWFRDQSGEQRFALASRGFFGHCLIPEEKPASPELCLIVSLLRIARIPSQFMGECQIADAGLQPLSLLKKKEAWQ